MKKVLFMVFGLLLSMAFTACNDDKDDEIPTNRYTLLVTSTTYNYDNNEELSKAVEAMLDKYRTEGIYIDGTQAEATALWRQACNEMLLFNWADTDIDISAETSIYITLALVTDKPGGNPVINRQHITFPEMYYHFVTASMTSSLANNVLAYNRIKTLIDHYNSPYEGGKYKRATIDDVFRASREDAISLFEELYNELINYPWKRVDITLLKDSRFTLILAYGSGRNMNTVISREVLLTDNTPSW